MTLTNRLYILLSFLKFFLLDGRSRATLLSDFASEFSDAIGLYLETNLLWLIYRAPSRSKAFTDGEIFLHDELSTWPPGSLTTIEGIGCTWISTSHAQIENTVLKLCGRLATLVLTLDEVKITLSDTAFQARIRLSFWGVGILTDYMCLLSTILH
jgi:hypothetical protein